MIVGGVLATTGASAVFGLAPAGMLALATLWFATSGPSILGATSVDFRSVDLDPREVRRYREGHPGATIIESASAIARR